MLLLLDKTLKGSRNIQGFALIRAVLLPYLYALQNNWWQAPQFMIKTMFVPDISAAKQNHVSYDSLPTSGFLTFGQSSQVF